MTFTTILINGEHYKVTNRLKSTLVTSTLK
nr:MAG TPA: hypothetical protein [Bacteriophage sp.]